jgi:hypothetical protein
MAQQFGTESACLQRRTREFISLRGFIMRSDLVFAAMTHVSNRYILTRLAATATRKLHKPNTRIEDTTNDVLMRFSRMDPTANAEPLQQPATLRNAA